MSMNPDFEALLASHEFLKDFNPKHVALLAKFTHLESLAEGDYIFRAGEPAEGFYLIREGYISLEVYDPRRGAVTLENLGANRALGWSWLIPPHQWTFDSRVLRSTEVLVLNAESFRNAMEENHELGYNILKRFVGVFADRLRASRLQLLDMYGLSMNP